MDPTKSTSIPRHPLFFHSFTLLSRVPVKRALHLNGTSQGEAVETVGVVLYTVVATLLVYQLHSTLWRAAADRTSKTDSAADAGFTAGDAADAHVGDHGDAG